MILNIFWRIRNTVKLPSWIKNRWVSAELSYNVTSSQRISVMYGSIQGGLFVVMECVESYQLLMMVLRLLTVQAFKTWDLYHFTLFNLYIRL